jgi:formate dehydrogenase
VEVTVEDNRVTKISADKQNPHTWQDFCAKGRTANQLVEHPRRILNPMRRVGDSYVEAGWDDAINDIATRMNALIDADGPDAVGLYYGNPSGFSSSNIIFMNAWLDAVGTHSRYAVGSVDQNAWHVVAEAMYGSMLMAPVSDIDNCDYFLLVGTNPAVSAWNWLETVPGGWLARARETEAGRHDRRRRPVAHQDRGEGRRSSRGPARTGLGAVAGHGQGDPRRGSRAPTGLHRTRDGRR